MNKVFRCYTEKRQGFDLDAKGLLAELRTNLTIDGLTDIRILNRYDVQGIDADVYSAARVNVFSEPQCDDCFDEELPSTDGASWILAVESLPGQYDQRADSCAQCIQIMATGDRPTVRAAKLYVFYGTLSDNDRDRIKGHLINPVECREASLDKVETLVADYGVPKDVRIIDGFISMDESGLLSLHTELGLAMDMDDLRFLQNYFANDEHRDPTLTEIRMVDTYWSDHCRHTTFATHLENIVIEDERVRQAFGEYLKAREEIYGEEKASCRPVTLMDVATCGVKALKKRGVLKNLDESEEINACSIKIKVNVNGVDEDWLLMFKNETHNHPTEIEPFGGAATCLGGAIRDPLSGRSYVYQAMRVTGCADPRTPIDETIPGKLPQRRITQTAAAGYSSYGNQIGLATGLVREIYHPRYVAKRMEIGAVIGAAPEHNVVRERPAPGDVVVLLGGRTGRDGCGGATGSSKVHTEKSLETCSAEVQKGNPPEERKIQRLFRNPEATRMIKRCNDFGAGGVSVAIGELADGLLIDLDRVPKKYDGLDGTELAISESQERMAVVVKAEDADRFMALATTENLEANVVATVQEENRLQMTWRGKTICDISRDFLNTNGADKRMQATVTKLDKPVSKEPKGNNHTEKMLNLVSDLNVCSQRGLGERFDGSIGANSVLAPYGGKNHLSPADVMVSKLPVLTGETDTVSAMAYGYDPYLTEQNPFIGASSAVVESVAKLVAAGFDKNTVYLTFQEYFERLGTDATRWGKPLSALLGGFTAQTGLNMAAIGGKDSMSGSYKDIDVPPTLVSFAVAVGKAQDTVVSELSSANNPIYRFDAKYNEDGTPDYTAIGEMWEKYFALCQAGKVRSARALSVGGTAEAVFKLAVGGNVGIEITNLSDFYGQNYGGIVAELTEDCGFGVRIGHTVSNAVIIIDGEQIPMELLTKAWQSVLEPIFPVNAQGQSAETVENISCEIRSTAKPLIKTPKPLAVLPVFPGTNCEYDTARAIERAGGEAKIIVIKNLTGSALEESVEAMYNAISQAQMIVIPGGFSGGDEPDGSGKFIAAFFRNKKITDAVHELLSNRDGLMLGICNGFQALIKLGLVPYGEIRAMDDTCPTLTYNRIRRHQARYVDTRVASVKSPWLCDCNVGDIHSVAISHGEGRFVADEATMKSLIANGQVAFQYVDSKGNATMDIHYNPNGSAMAIEGILSPDGRVLGKMAHTERSGANIGMNICGNKLQPIFESGVKYFK